MKTACCSHRFHLSGNNRRDSRFTGLLIGSGAGHLVGSVLDRPNPSPTRRAMLFVRPMTHRPVIPWQTPMTIDGYESQEARGGAAQLQGRIVCFIGVY